MATLDGKMGETNVLLSKKASRGPPLVFLDTTALKFASERIIRGVIRPVTVNWGGKDVTLNVTQFVEVFPNSKVDSVLAAELRKLQFIAHLARSGRIRLTTHQETLWEYFGLPKTDDPRGRFYGAPIHSSPDPFSYGRVFAGGGSRAADYQFDFMKGITHPRYLQLKKAVGADPNSGKFKNQLLDAFHLLCAESSRADYFLTLDFKLIKHVSGHKRLPPTVPLVRPSELVKRLLAMRNARIRDAFSFARHLIKERSTPSDHPYEQLVSLGKVLERKGMFRK